MVTGASVRLCLEKNLNNLRRKFTDPISFVKFKNLYDWFMMVDVVLEGTSGRLRHELIFNSGDVGNLAP
ncbi:MAG: hypothetical protein JWN83_1268 [Chitinophagaceae bacterium]|nr:hypothetical protein [Chitinophagaceae bacterium]